MKPLKDSSLCSINQVTRLKYLALAILFSSLWACGGSSSSPSSPTPVAVATPEPCAQNVIYGGSGEMPSRTVLRFPVTAPSAGRLDITADWTFDTNPVGLYLVQGGGCTIEEFNARSCAFLLQVETGAKPVKGSAPVQAGSYTVLLGNYGSRDDSGTMQIVMSTGSCPAPVSSSSATGSAVGGTVRRMGNFHP